jgi:hypothetical protein
MRYLSCILTLILISAFSVYAAEKVYTEDDLKSYDYGNGEVDNDKSDSSHSFQLKSSETSQNSEAEYWCNRMTNAKNRVKNAFLATVDSGVTARGVQKTYGTRYIGGQAVADARIEENKARNELRSAEDDVRNIEEEAHRKGIPPGWLDCNFH